jgi:hypothetical protein
MLLANDLSASQADTILAANVTVLAVSLALFAIVALVVMVPAALRALASQQVIFDTLLDVPVEITAALRDRYAKKIEEVHRMQEAAALGIDVDENAAEAPPVFEDMGPQEARVGDTANLAGRGSVVIPQDGLQTVINAYAQKRAASEAASHATATISERRGCCKCGGSKSFTGKHGKRRFRRAKSSRNFLLISLLWPVALYCSYFVGMFFWRLELVTFASYAKVTNMELRKMLPHPRGTHSCVLVSRAV